MGTSEVKNFNEALEELKAAAAEHLLGGDTAKISDNLKSAIFMFAIFGLVEVIEAPKKIAEAIEKGAGVIVVELSAGVVGSITNVEEAIDRVGETLERIHEVLENTHPKPDLDEHGLAIPPMPSRSENLLQRLVSSVEDFVGRGHVVR